MLCIQDKKVKKGTTFITLKLTQCNPFRLPFYYPLRSVFAIVFTWEQHISQLLSIFISGIMFQRNFNMIAADPTKTKEKQNKSNAGINKSVSDFKNATLQQLVKLQHSHLCAPVI